MVEFIQTRLLAPVSWLASGKSKVDAVAVVPERVRVFDAPELPQVLDFN